ncbi:hypothetical protein QUF80_02570 [Desulfococcaceae bacterium HSG8]|nr:hypothetical protein [Desulfococcaceae bacterium HSG8]
MKANSKDHFLRVRRRANFVIVRILILCVFFTGCVDTTSPQIDAVKSAISRSAGYLADNTEKNGMFKYRINMDPATEVKERYNILRHAGTIYAMCMYYQLYPDVNLQSAIERAGRYLRDEAIHPIPGRDDMLAVWSEPEVNRSGKPLQAKLGGTGLGLVALLSLENIRPGFTPLSDLQSLGRFIVYMQKEDGRFYSKFIPSKGGRWDKWQSLYYPGEAALGLLMLYEKDASDVWIESAAKALAYMARSRKNRTDIPADHWALLATKKMLSLENKDELPVSRNLLISHAVRICDTILQSQIVNPERPEYDGGFSKDGRTTPTATRLEGLQAALSFLPPNHKVRKWIESSVTLGIAFLLRAQIIEGEFVGAFPRAVGKISKNIPNADKFNRRSTEVRIDYVQHALSAMIQYLHLMNDKK